MSMKSVGGNVVILAVAAALVGSAQAGGVWSDQVTYKPARKTSLKVTGPDGFHLRLTSADGDKDSTVPELFDLPDEDAYVTVTLTSTQGDGWSKKLEVKPHRQTELAVTYAVGRTYTGKLANLGYVCGSSYNAAIRIDFVRADGTVVKQQQIASRQTASVVVDGGTYQLRAYVAAGGVWTPSITGSSTIAKDGWSLGFGCRTVGSGAPEIVAQP